MKLIKQRIEEVTFHIPEGYPSIEKWIETVARTCWKSEGKITDESAEAFLLKLINSDHLAMFEHAIISARIITDRGIMAELTRHRLASFAIESSRYCNYTKDKFNNEVVFIESFNDNWSKEQIKEYTESLKKAEKTYFSLIKSGIHQQIARNVLPMALKTELVITANLREWMTIINLRTSTAAHPMIKDLMIELLIIFYSKLNIIFRKQFERKQEKKEE